MKSLLKISALCALFSIPSLSLCQDLLVKETAAPAQNKPIPSKNSPAQNPTQFVFTLKALLRTNNEVLGTNPEGKKILPQVLLHHKAIAKCIFDWTNDKHDKVQCKAIAQDLHFLDNFELEHLEENLKPLQDALKEDGITFNKIDFNIHNHDHNKDLIDVDFCIEASMGKIPHEEIIKNIEDSFKRENNSAAAPHLKHPEFLEVNVHMTGNGMTKGFSKAIRPQAQ